MFRGIDQNRDDSCVSRSTGRNGASSNGAKGDSTSFMFCFDQNFATLSLSMSFSNHALFGRISRILGVLATLVVIVAGMVWIGNMQDHANDPQALTVPVSDSDWYEGGKDATVTLVEYSDFQCPACASFFPVLQGLLQNYGDKLKIVYRNYPLTQLHPNAQLAAQAAEAAGMQGRFFDMHDVLFSTQKDWSGLANPTDNFIAYATQIGLNVDQFKTDLTSSGVKDAIAQDVRGGNRSNVDSTPTFFLNGLQITSNPQGLAPFMTLIDAALNPAPAADTSATPTTTP